MREKGTEWDMEEREYGAQFRAKETHYYLQQKSDRIKS